MRIPEYIKITERQSTRFKEWTAALPPSRSSDEDCSPMSRVSFIVRAGSIVDEIIAHDRETSLQCHLTLDDDNQFSR